MRDLKNKANEIISSRVVDELEGQRQQQNSNNKKKLNRDIYKPAGEEGQRQHHKIDNKKN